MPMTAPMSRPSQFDPAESNPFRANPTLSGWIGEVVSADSKIHSDQIRQNPTRSNDLRWAALRVLPSSCESFRVTEEKIKCAERVNRRMLREGRGCDERDSPKLFTIMDALPTVLL